MSADAMIDASIFQLPWQIQTALASGYAAYMVGFYGLRRDHQAIDTFFVSLVFSLVATLGLLLCSHLAPWAAIVLSFLSTIAAAVVWRKWLRLIFQATLRLISWSDNYSSARATLQANDEVLFSQVAVLLKDGTWLRCDDPWRFRLSPHGPFTWGASGDVAMYLTHIQEPNGTVTEQTTVQDRDRGERITYVSAEQIAEIAIRLQRPNRSLTTEVAPEGAYS